MIDYTQDKARLSLLEIIRSKTVIVTFTKSDGSSRDLRGTLNADLIPSEHYPKRSEDTVHSDEYTRIFDLDKQQWRSFRFDSVTNISYE